MRVSGTLFVLFIVIIEIGEGMPKPFTQPTCSQTISLALALIMNGFLIAWRRELAGGLISLATFCLGVVPLSDSPKGLTWFYFALTLMGTFSVTCALFKSLCEKTSIGLTDCCSQSGMAHPVPISRTTASAPHGRTLDVRPLEPNGDLLTVTILQTVPHISLDGRSQSFRAAFAPSVSTNPQVYLFAH